MSVWYLDTSAAIKLVQNEDESEALITQINDTQPILASCWLLDTEMRRATYRSEAMTHALVSRFLETVEMHEMPASLFREAGYVAAENLRSLDALHVTAAIRIGADFLVTYDLRLAEAARAAGLHVLAPA